MQASRGTRLSSMGDRFRQTIRGPTRRLRLWKTYLTLDDRPWTINDLANQTQPFIRDTLRQKAPGGGIPQSDFVWADLPKGLEVTPIPLLDNETFHLIRGFEKVNEEFTARDYVRFRQIYVQKYPEIAPPRIEAMPMLRRILRERGCMLDELWRASGLRD